MSERYLCLHCWRALPLDELFYRCEACAGGDDRPRWLARGGGDDAPRPVAEAKRSWLAGALADEEAAVRCRHHDDAAIRLYCVCGYPLSERARLGSRAPLGLGIAGPRGAGKTLLILTMMRRLHQLDLGGSPLGIVGLDDTEARFHALAAGLFDHGAKPDATHSPEPATRWRDGGEVHGNFAWRLTVEGAGRRRPSLLVAVYDLGGETWGLPPDARHVAFDRYLGHLGSLALLVDGMAMAADLGYEVDDAWDRHPPPGDGGASSRQWFGRIVDRLGERARQVDLAVVISKADCLWDRDGWGPLAGDAGGAPDGAPDEAARQELLARLLAEAHRRDVVLEARQRFRSVRVFAVSSLGFRPGPDDVDADGRLRREIAPAGVTEPLAWLLGQRLPVLRER